MRSPRRWRRSPMSGLPRRGSSPRRSGARPIAPACRRAGYWRAGGGPRGPGAGPRARPGTAVEALRQRVMAALATPFDSRLSRWATAASQPPNFQAYQEFIAGLDRFVQFDMRGAVAHFERAAAV